ncbi:MAG: di-trans,poly-cis-decaprenylcistransferase [Chloroflexi bacterium]|nr:di-trans,poly-cis-decaprenylcistransferase [Chloroflexota bacterium]MBI4507399.1 di-trans,poly-cis-decaprenylcistransferase [Chloroflexota bacterium]
MQTTTRPLEAATALAGTAEGICPVPRHVAIIMDGNGRWAEARGLPRLAGHRAGTENIRRVLKAAVEFGVETLTIYAFSTENWGRPAEEVQGLLQLLEIVIRREAKHLHANGVRVRHIGRLDGVPERLAKAIRRVLELTAANDRITLNVAFNYGGRSEIVEAARSMVRAGLRPEEIDEETVARFLYTAGQADPDLIVRTGGEMRLSNFLLWQAAYAEYYATPTYWPDFDREELRRAVVAFSQRRRRFGRL